MAARNLEDGQSWEFLPHGILEAPQEAAEHLRHPGQSEHLKEGVYCGRGHTHMQQTNRDEDPPAQFTLHRVNLEAREAGGEGVLF